MKDLLSMHIHHQKLQHGGEIEHMVKTGTSIYNNQLTVDLFFRQYSNVIE